MNLAQALNGLSLGALLLILSSGLAIIYGLRGVMNFAHGSLYMLGAYIAYTVTDLTSWWLALLVAPAALAIVGVLLEASIFRRLQSRTRMDVGLITFGLALIIERLVAIVWGEQTLPVSAPAALNGTANVVGTEYPVYRLFLIGVALVVAAGLVAWLRYSRTGLHVRAASQDGLTSAVVGVNVDRVSLVVVALGSALAGLAGVLAGPLLSAQPGMGQTIIVTVLIVVVIGGIGSIAGAIIASIAVGLLQTVGAVWLPSVSALVPYMALVAVLLWRPTGIAGKRVD
jgi:branched-chain amino acid transport system permease protein